MARTNYLGKSPETLLIEKILNRYERGRNYILLIIFLNSIAFAVQALYSYKLLDIKYEQLPLYDPSIVQVNADLPFITHVGPFVSTPNNLVDLSNYIASNLFFVLIAHIFLCFGRTWGRWLVLLLSVYGGFKTLTAGSLLFTTNTDLFWGTLLLAIAICYFLAAWILFFAKSLKIYAMYIRA